MEEKFYISERPQTMPRYWGAYIIGAGILGLGLDIGLWLGLSIGPDDYIQIGSQTSLYLTPGSALAGVVALMMMRRFVQVNL